MSDFIIENGVLLKYTTDRVAYASIPEGVTAIGSGAFKGRMVLKAVIIPESVTVIGSEAFVGCTNLRTVNIPAGVTEIGDRAFRMCEKLKSITIPEGVTTIGQGAFSGCIRLSDVNIPTGITQIGNDAFRGCAVETIAIPEGVTAIGSFAFASCKNLTAVNIPGGVHRIGVGAFQTCTGLTSIDIPESVTYLSDTAFDFCYQIRQVTLPVHLAAIAKAFSSGSSMRIRIADLSALPVKYRLCAVLCYAEDGGNPADPRFESHIKYLKTNAGKLVEIAVQSLPLLTLLCREKCIKAKDIEAYVTAVQATGDVEKIALVLDYQNSGLTAKQKEKAAKQKEKQSDTVFDRAIARMNQVGIAGLNFVVTGDLETFENRKELKAFLESQGAKLQSAMSAKTDYLIMNNASSHTEKAQRAKELGIDILTEGEFNDKAGRAFVVEDGVLIKYQGAGGDVVIPDGIKEIGKKLFDDCDNLTSVTIPEGTTIIGAHAFQFCRNLVHVTIPDGVTTIGRSAFWCCRKLTDITIPGSVTSIGTNVFSTCSSLTAVILPDSITLIDDYTFASCPGLQKVVIPDSVTAIAKDAFLNSDHVTIHGKAGSYAETYAKKRKIPFLAE